MLTVMISSDKLDSVPNESCISLAMVALNWLSLADWSISLKMSSLFNCSVSNDEQLPSTLSSWLMLNFIVSISRGSFHCSAGSHESSAFTGLSDGGDDTGGGGVVLLSTGSEDKVSSSEESILVIIGGRSSVVMMLCCAAWIGCRS